MITLSIVERVKAPKSKQVSIKRYIEVFHSTDKAKKFIIPVVKEMRLAKSEKRDPRICIEAVSYDTESERKLLLELKAITSIDNESDNQY